MLSLRVSRRQVLYQTIWVVWIGGLALWLAACAGSLSAPTVTEEDVPMSIQLTSSAFAEGAEIPVQYTCDGKNASPPLTWSDVPAGVKSFALIADDPDAPGGTWVHWVLYDLPPDATQLPEDTPATQMLSNGAKHGVNDFRKLGFGGPCPPKGTPHRYFFKLYALDAQLQMKPGATKQDVLRAMQGHILAEGQLMGTYKRR
jgi:Raf kinase inhibitor-like YbhB/YbcL family protein